MDAYDYYEVRFGKNNFMHLAGIKSESLSANEFYEACVGGEITREDCNPRRDANTMYSKVAIMEQMLDLRNSKCYKIGKKNLITRDNDFEMATGNMNGVMGYDSRIRIIFYEIKRALFQTEKEFFTDGLKALISI